MIKDSAYYYISCFWGKLDNKKISENEFRIIEDKSNKIKKLLNEIDYFPLVLMNCYEFNHYCTTTLQQNKDDFITINRLFSNLVNSFYMWIGYNERYYATYFKNLKSNFYDSDFCYRFLYTMRTYTAHNSLPITKVSTDILKDKTIVLIKIADLTSKDSGINEKFRNELVKMNVDEINVFDVTSDFINAFSRWQIEIWNAIKSDLCNDIIAVNKITPILAPWFVNTYICSSNNEISIPIGHQIKYLNDRSKLYNYNFLSFLFNDN